MFFYFFPRLAFVPPATKSLEAAESGTPFFFVVLPWAVAAGRRRFWRGPFGRQVGRGGFFLAASGMESHAAGSSSGGSGDGAAQPRRNSRKPKCEIFFLNMILLMLSLFRVQSRILSLLSFLFSLGFGTFSFGYF